jgi:hypothetical protein
MSREKTPSIPVIKKRAPRKSAAATAKAAVSWTSFVGPEQRSALIAEAAYFRAEKRGFATGREVEDWLAAEAEVDVRLMRAIGSAPRV